MDMPELYDLVYHDNGSKVDDYYRTNRVLKLGEYAINSLATNYKYNVLPHFIARGGDSEARFVPLDYLRRLRVSYFFDDEAFLDEFLRFQEVYNIMVEFICSSGDGYFRR